MLYGINYLELEYSIRYKYCKVKLYIYLNRFKYLIIGFV